MLLIPNPDRFYSSQTKIANLNSPVIRQKNIIGFQVPVTTTVVRQLQ